MSIPKRMYELYCRDFAREAKAVAMAESQEDPLAMSPGGMGVGIMQQAAPWQKDYAPVLAALSEAPTLLMRFKSVVGAKTGVWIYDHATMTDRRWHPAYQLACYATFVWKHKQLDKLARWRLYHYGHETDQDPDGYANRVAEFWTQLQGW